MASDLQTVNSIMLVCVTGRAATNLGLCVSKSSVANGTDSQGGTVEWVLHPDSCDCMLANQHDGVWNVVVISNCAAVINSKKSFKKLLLYHGRANREEIRRKRRWYKQFYSIYTINVNKYTDTTYV